MSAASIAGGLRPVGNGRWCLLVPRLYLSRILIRLQWLGPVCLFAACQWQPGPSSATAPPSTAAAPAALPAPATERVAPAATDAAATPVLPIARVELKSGIEFASAELRAQQADVILNPGMLWVDRGARVWEQSPAAGQPACSTCHGPVGSAMKGVSARLPRVSADGAHIENLQSLINRCRTQRQAQPALSYESGTMLDLSAVIAHQSAGLPVQVNISGAARSHWEQGRQLYHQRIGQINLACTHCHDQQWGKRLYNETISQGHGNAYPIYRLEWQSVGSLHRRFRSCQFGVRAPLLPHGHPDFLALELYLAWRGGGLAVEAPGVRR